MSGLITVKRGRNHVFKLGGPIPWSRVLLSFYRKKLDRSTQFGAVVYMHTLFIKKLCKKLGGPSKFFGGPDPRPPSGCAHAVKFRLDTRQQYIKCTTVNARNGNGYSRDAPNFLPTPKTWLRHCTATGRKSYGFILLLL